MPPLTASVFDLISPSPDRTMQLGEALGERLTSGDVVCLSGELGAGKTTFAIGLGRGWGALDPVTSPTFVIVNEYRRADGGCLRHLDCYRLRTSAEAWALGFDDLLAEPGAMLIEWPERIAEALPPEHLHITLSWVDDTQRGLHFAAHGARALALLYALQPALV